MLDNKKILLCIEQNDFFFPGFLDRFLRSHPSNWNVSVAITYNKKPIKEKVLYYLWLANFFRFNGILKLTSKKLKKFLQSFLLNFNINNGVYRIKDIERKYNKKLLKFADINSKESLLFIQKLDLDVIVSLQSVIFQEQLLNIPKVSCLNKHAALLPKYRGVWPVFWSLLNNEKEYGYTIHEMTPKIDVGNIFYQEKIEYNDGDTIYTLYKRIFSKLSKGLILAIKSAVNGTHENHGKSNEYYSFPKPNDISEFYKAGNKVV